VQRRTRYVGCSRRYDAICSLTSRFIVVMFSVRGVVRNPAASSTEGLDSLCLVGSNTWNRNMFINLIQQVCLLQQPFLGHA
jgi:hypothetical protein